MDSKDYITSGIIQQYILGLCTPQEAEELERLRLQDAELDQAIIAFEEKLEKDLQSGSILPPQSIDDKILAKIDSLKQATIVSIQNTQESSGKSGWPKWIAAASVILLLASVYYNYSLLKKTKDQQAEIDNAKKPPAGSTLPLSDYQVMLDKTITPVALYGVGSHAICRCTMFWDKKTGKAYIMIHHLPQSDDQRDYQLWAFVDGKPVSAGIIKDEIRGRFIEITNIPNGATSFTVTLENAGGSSTPTESETYLRGVI